MRVSLEDAVEILSRQRSFRNNPKSYIEDALEAGIQHGEIDSNGLGLKLAHCFRRILCVLAMTCVLCSRNNWRVALGMGTFDIEKEWEERRHPLFELFEFPYYGHYSPLCDRCEGKFSVWVKQEPGLKKLLKKYTRREIKVCKTRSYSPLFDGEVESYADLGLVLYREYLEYLDSRSIMVRFMVFQMLEHHSVNKRYRL